MKKVLLASTALVLTAGYAAAEVEVTGSANMGVKYIEGAEVDVIIGTDPVTEEPIFEPTDNEVILHYEVDFNIVGSGSTDGGLDFGASVDVDAGPSNDGTVSDPEIFVSGAFGTLTVGGVDAAADSLSLGFADVGFDGIGIDDTAETFLGAGSYNAHYSASFGDFTFVASMSAAKFDSEGSEDFSVAAEYGFGDIVVAAGYSSLNDTIVGEGDMVAVGIEGDAAGFGYDLFYHQMDGEAADVAGYGGSVSYASGPWVYTAAVGATDLDDDEVDFGVGAEYDLGGGAALGAGIGSRDDPFSDDDSAIVADFGINLSF